MDSPKKGTGGAQVWRPKPSTPTRAESADDKPTTDPLATLRAWWKDGKAPVTDAEGLFSLVKDVARTARDKVTEHLDADVMLVHAMAGFIELAGSRYALDPGERWAKGEPLRMLLAGYNGTRNTGADVRVEEMIRQFRHIFDDEHLELSVFTLDPELTRGYFRTVRQLHIPKVFPKYLFDVIHGQHAVVACEGSMFKSKFASALATMMVGALGIASVEQKIAVGYGGEAGAMDPALEELVKKYCRDALILARNEASRDVLLELGVQSTPGTDTAWTFDPSPREVGERILREHGWNGTSKVLAVCPINPFWFPVKPNVGRAFVNAFSGIHDDVHYGSVYFHQDDADVETKQERYLDAIANAVGRFAKDRDVFVAMMGSEQLDRSACEALNERLGGGHPVLVSDELDMYDMVSVMRTATWMVSSRYHACVTTMAGGVISGGITMDERIKNLMADRGQPELSLDCTDPDLEEKTYAMLLHLEKDAEALREGIDRCVVKNLVRMGEMGIVMVEHVRSHHPEFPFRDGLGRGGDPWAHLPTLPPAVQAIVERTGRV